MADGSREGSKSTTAARHRGHMPILDALRGVAVLMVVVFHFAWTFPESTRFASMVHKVMWTGWIGVDLFFVLSGYLITRGLVTPSSMAVRKRLRLFWMRRILRIFPLYFIVLAAGSAVAVATGREAPSWEFWFYLQNYVMAFDPFHVIRWTSHFWSLAVEEQFYLVWPLAMLLVPRTRRVTLTFTLLSLGAILRAIIVFKAPFGPEPSAKMAYVAMPTHLDGLLGGALLAMLEQGDAPWLLLVVRRIRRPAIVVAWLGVVGLAVVSRGLSPYDRRVAVIGFPLLAVGFALVLSQLVDRGDAAMRGRVEPPSPPGGSASWVGRGLQACGRVSYGMYVFHWPVVVILMPTMVALQARVAPATAFGAGLALIIAGIVFSYGLAELSFRYVEAPFLKRKESFSETPVR